ncbi:MAG: metallophosphoesterase, partial [Clostridia bacterium]
MAIYAISDLHLSFGEDKPMDIFGDNWENHAEKIKEDWLNKVTEEDTILLPGDFSWAMKLEDTKKDFEYLVNLPGKKILLKGNHDYWWTTLAKMKEFLDKNHFGDIYFLYNNSYLVEETII